MIYILQEMYVPNAASVIRNLTLARGFDELDIPFRLVYLWPDVKCDKTNAISADKIMYCWKNRVPSNKVLLTLQFRFYKKFLFKRIVRNFCKTLKPGDIIHYYSGRMLHYVLEQLQGKGVKVYYECTEHPYVSSPFKTKEDLEQNFQDCKRVDGLFVVSNSLKEAFIDFGVPEEKITVINMIVDRSRFEGVQKNPSAEKYIAYCGTITNRKDGVDDLIRSFSVVARRVPDVKLYIIGRYVIPAEAEANQRLIEELGLSDRVISTGVVDASKMPQMLKDAQALVLARPDNQQAQNGFPSKLGEYLLTENPVIVTRTSDISLYLEDGISALLAEPGNCNEIGEKIIWALEHPKEAEIIGKAGKEVALKNFNSRIEAQKMYEVMCKG